MLTYARLFVSVFQQLIMLYSLSYIIRGPTAYGQL